MTDFAVRIYLSNHYLASPLLYVDHVINEFTCKYIAKVPIIRIFGCTPCGQKVCAHIHGVYPYFYVPFNDDISVITNSDFQKRYLLNFTSSLDRAVNIALNGHLDQNHVFKIVLVKGRQFYGFQKDYQYFLKIYLYNPGMVKKVADLLANGAINNRRFQPFEAHIPYTLQFFIDYNLYGMNYLYTNCAKFRIPAGYAPKTQSVQKTQINSVFVSPNEELSQKMWNTDFLDENLIMNQSNSTKQSKCEIEIDICACDILNIHEIEDSIGQNPGLKNLWEEEKLRRMNLGMDPKDVIGEEIEDRPLSRTTESHEELSDRWRAILAQAKEKEQNIEDSVDDFLNASFDDNFIEDDQSEIVKSPIQPIEIEKDDDILLVSEESVIKATQLSESFLVENNEENQNESICGSQKAQSQQSKKTFVKSIHKLEEDDSIIPPVDDMNDDIDDDICIWNDGNKNDDDDEGMFNFSFLSQGTVCDTGGNAMKSQKVLSFSQASQIKDEVKIVSGKFEKNESSEDLFNTTFFDLTGNEDEEDIQVVKEASKNTSIQKYDQEQPSTSKAVNKSSEDLFLGISISSQSTTSSQPHQLSQDNLNESGYRLNNFDGVDDDSSSTDNSTDSDVMITDISYPSTSAAQLPSTSAIIKNTKDSQKSTNSSSYATELLSLSKILKTSSRTIKKSSNTINKRRATSSINMKTNSKVHKSTNLALQIKVSPQKPVQSPSPSTSMINKKLFAASTPTRNIQKPPIRMDDTISPIIKEKRKQLAIDRALISPINDRSNHQQFVKKKYELPIKFVQNEKSMDSPRKLFNNTLNETASRSQKIDLLKKMRTSVMSQSFSGFNSSTMVQQSHSLVGGIQDYKFSHLTLLSMEIFTSSRHDLLPDPYFDKIIFICYSILHVPDSEVDNDEQDTSFNDINNSYNWEFGIIYDRENSTQNLLSGSNFNNSPMLSKYPVTNENELFDKLMDIVQLYDPDILVGYDTHKQSWGYLLQRAAYINHRLYLEMGRMINIDQKQLWIKKDPQYLNHISELHCDGRIIFDLWSIFRYELTETSYSFENSVNTILKERAPFFVNQQLLAWWKNNLKRHIVLNYIKYRVFSNVQMLLKLNTVRKMSEFARIYGIEFYHVMSRGSQFRVESMMLRLAKPQSLIALSPSVSQRAHQKAPECIPLTLEPYSGFYRDPVAVLDFQSLYPSIMIAYNLCYASCIGKLDHIEQAVNPIKLDIDYEIGCSSMNLPHKSILHIGENVSITPNGVVFVKDSVQPGIISKMVDEILNTRIMVKKSMKIHKNNKLLHRLLDSRQLGLKLIANVTFGYTAASFSGRMPCVEVGDSIVRKARETLERAIALIKDKSSGGDDMWRGLEVLYGDTDSVFVRMPGRTKEEAFKIGALIAETVTADNPFPVKLKFEKIFHPCILESKKRYVGYSYETLEQKEPLFDAKGIETVRRDNCNIVAMILQRSLERLFESNEIISVKRYVQNELKKIMEGRYNVLDFIIAKEYRGRYKYKSNTAVPALAVANALREKDPRAEPRSHDRVPYVIVQGAPGETLFSCIRHPLHILFNTDILRGYAGNIRYRCLESHCKISVNYYINKQILPPLQRAFCLIGENVFRWYSDMPKYPDLFSRMSRSRISYSNHKSKATNNTGHQNQCFTISSYFQLRHCLLCESQIQNVTNPISKDESYGLICEICRRKGRDFILRTATVKLCHIQSDRRILVENCLSCCNRSSFPLDPTGVGPPCVSLDCPILFSRISAFQFDTEDLERVIQALKTTKL